MSERDTVFGAGLVVVLLVVMFGAATYFQVGKANESKDSLTRLREGDSIRIGYANEAPYGFLNSETGRVTGEAPEIARAILTKVGVKKIEPVVTEFGSLIPGLKAGRFDLIAAGMYITPERCKEAAFSNPTYKIGEAFVVLKNNPLGLHSFEDVAENEKARIGVMGGAQEHRYARALGVPEDRIVVVPDYPTGLTALKSGRLDCVAATVLTAHDLLHKDTSQKLELAQPFTDPIIDGKSVQGYGAFAFRKEDTALVAAFNKELASFIGSPEHLALVKPFGFSEATLPGDMTAERLCGQKEKSGAH